MRVSAVSLPAVSLSTVSRPWPRSAPAALVLALAGLAACGGDDTTPFPVEDHCNPLGFDACMAPWPSGVFEVADSRTPTGRQLAIPAGALLTSVSGTPVDPAGWNRADGFSASTPIVVAFPSGIDGSNLVNQTRFGDSLGAAATTVVLDMTTMERVAHMAELDMTAGVAPDRQALIIRPAARLTPGHRYAVAIRKAIKARDGGDLPSSPGFQAIVDGTATGHPLLEAARPRLIEALDALATAGFPRADLALAWDFTVASDDFVHRVPKSARDQTLAALDATPTTYTIVSDAPVGDGQQIRRRIDGTFKAPLFLTQNGAYAPGTVLDLDANGLPLMRGMYDIPFTAIVPTCAYTATERVGLMIYGHGLNGSGEQAASGAIRDTAAAACVITVGTDMRGMSSRDVGNIARALTDLNNASEIFDVLIQGLANHVALARALETTMATQLFVCRPDDATATGCTEGAMLGDPAKLYYYGLSQGHIFGTTFVAYTPNLRRGVIGVGGGNYSIMLERSSNWPTYRQILHGAYPDDLDVVLAIALFQQRWDHSETAGVSSVVLDGTALGVTPRQLLLHMAIGDDQVPNLATEWQARTMGIPVLEPSPDLPYGLTGVTGPIAGGSALVIMDGGAPPPPLTNEPSPDTGMHSLTRNQPASRRQIAHFFATGEVRNECDGACFCAAGKCN